MPPEGGPEHPGGGDAAPPRSNTPRSITPKRATQHRFLRPAHVQDGTGGGTDRRMWTAITLKRVAGSWRIAAIRNMLPPEGARSDRWRPAWPDMMPQPRDVSIRTELRPGDLRAIARLHR